MFDRRRGVIVSLLFLALFSSALFAQQPRPSGTRIPGTYKQPRDFGTQYRIDMPETEYGLQPGQGISEVQVVLAERRADVRTAREDVVGRAGRVVAMGRTGVGGGVTFNNVQPGTYVLLIQMTEPSNIQANDRHASPVLVASLGSEVADAPYYVVKSFFESRSNIAKRTAGADGREWRTFPEGFVYAVRAPNLVSGDEECRRARNELSHRETVIAQEFKIGGSAPVSVTAAVGRSL